MVLFNDVVQRFLLLEFGQAQKLIRPYPLGGAQTGRVPVDSDGTRIGLCCFNDLRKKRRAAAASRLALSRKSMVLPRASTTQYRHLHRPFTRT